jgi:hypothetical protein
MTMKRLTLVFLCAVGFLLSAPILHATVYIAVGTCKPDLKSYSTISAAVAAAPSGATVEVCPGTYAEQVTISTPLTLEGITYNNSNRAIVVPPSGGLKVNATSILGSLAAQVLVETGPVNITNVTVDGTNNDVKGSAYVAGIFYESGSSGTVDEVTARQQIDDDKGVGILAENENSTADTVTIENCDIHNVDYAGIVTGSSTPSTLTFTVKGNTVAGESVGPQFGILNLEATGSIASNVVSDFTSFGISDEEGVNVSISGNTTTNTTAHADTIGIYLGGADETVKSNLVLNNSSSGSDGIAIDIVSGLPAVQDNKIVNSEIAIEFFCNSATASGNTITDAATALDEIPAGLASTNFYYGVTTIQTSCSPGSVAKAKAALLSKKLPLPR